MINLRYHIVSITAVFLALGIGVLMGTTVIDQAVVSVLNRRLSDARDHSRRVEQLNGNLRSELEVWDRYGEQELPSLISGKLAGARVLLVAAPEAPTSLLDGIEQRLATAGALRAGRVSFTKRLALDDEAARSDLARILGDDPLAQPDQLLRDTAEHLAGRLTSVPTTSAGSKDDLGELAKAGFVEVEGIDLPRFPERATAIVVVGGDAGPPSPKELLARIFEFLPKGTVAAAVQALDSKSSLVQEIRRVPEIATAVATIDHADTIPGEISLVFALADLHGGRTAAHYGVGRGATAVAPPSAS